MRKAIFLAALMYSSAAVFGMQDERAVFTDGSNKSTLAEVVKPGEESHPKTMNNNPDELKNDFAWACDDYKRSHNDVEDLKWSYEFVGKLLGNNGKFEEVVDQLEEREAKNFVKRILSQLQDDGSYSDILGRLRESISSELQATKAHENQTLTRKNTLCQMIETDSLERFIKELNKLKSQSKDESTSNTSSITSSNNEDKSTSNTSSITSSNNTEKKTNIRSLYDYCMRRGSKVALADLNFEYPLENQRFNCKITVKNKYIDREYYDERFFSKSKKEAKEKIAFVVLMDLLNNKELNSSNGEDETEKHINEFFNLLKEKYNLVKDDVQIKYLVNKENGEYYAEVIIPKSRASLSLPARTFRSKKMAKVWTCQYLYRALAKEAN